MANLTPMGSINEGPGYATGCGEAMKKTNGINTKLAHCGPDPRAYHGFVNPPVVHASTVLFPDAQTMKTRNQPYTYGTRGTPTTDALCHALDELEGSAGTILVPSGLAAVTVPLLAFAKAGEHVLMVDTIYNPSRRFADTMLARLGVEVEYYLPDIGADIETLIRANTSVIFMEAPGSNTFEMQDVPAIAAVARKHSITTMIDNTWATPLFFKPLDHGVDISIHACTKYPAGHSDVLMGSVSANAATWEQLREAQLTLGICAAPDDSYQVLRGLRTMGLRLQRHGETALELAHWLNEDPRVAAVLHPALPDFPGHALWKRDFCGSSGIFSIVLKANSEKAADAFLNALDIFGLGYSWGGYESLAVHVNLSDRTISARDHGGPVMRLQIGLEDAVDLKADLEAALAAADAAG